MGIRAALLVWLVLFLVIVLSLYLVFGAISLWIFGGSIIGSALTFWVIFRVIEVEGYDHLIIRRGGTYLDSGVRGGRFFLIRTLDVPILVDMRPRAESVDGVHCFTQEGVVLQTSYFFLWQVADPMNFLLLSPGPDNAKTTLGQIATETLMNVVGRMNLQAVLQRRQYIATELNRALATLPGLADWGIYFVGAGLGEVKMPPDIAEAMARQVAIALITRARITEDVGAAQALNQMQSMLNNPAMLDRAMLLQVLRGLTEAIAQRK